MKLLLEILISIYAFPMILLSMVFGYNVKIELKK